MTPPEIDRSVKNPPWVRSPQIDPTRPRGDMVPRPGHLELRRSPRPTSGPSRGPPSPGRPPGGSAPTLDVRRLGLTGPENQFRKKCPTWAGVAAPTSESSPPGAATTQDIRRANGCHDHRLGDARSGRIPE